MPIVYSRRSPSPDSSSSPQIPLDSSDRQMSDEDDSIFLSDLVRTGEASRLRRRGAVRLDHGHSAGSSAAGLERISGATDGRRDSEAGPSLQERPLRPTARRRDSRRSREQETPSSYVLFCGGEEVEISASYNKQSPFTPSILPVVSTTSCSSTSAPERVSNGCGALIHLKAFPRARQGVWIAVAPPSDAVLTLDSSYFDKTTSSKLVRNACGCVREGLACAVCGLPLGTQYIPCQTVEHCASKNDHRAAFPSHPEGPSYWRPRLSHASNVVYSFFASAVSSSPPFNFSQRQSSTSSLQTDLSSLTSQVIPRPSYGEQPSFPAGSSGTSAPPPPPQDSPSGYSGDDGRTPASSSQRRSSTVEEVVSGLPSTSLDLLLSSFEPIPLPAPLSRRDSQASDSTLPAISIPDFPPVLDRLMTSSPRPMSELDEADGEQRIPGPSISLGRRFRPRRREEIISISPSPTSGMVPESSDWWFAAPRSIPPSNVTVGSPYLDSNPTILAQGSNRAASDDSPAPAIPLLPEVAQSEGSTSDMDRTLNDNSELRLQYDDINRLDFLDRDGNLMIDRFIGYGDDESTLDKIGEGLLDFGLVEVGLGTQPGMWMGTGVSVHPAVSLPER